MDLCGHKCILVQHKKPGTSFSNLTCVWCMPSVRLVYAFRAFGVCLPCVWCMPSMHVWCMPSMRLVYAFRAVGVCLLCVWCMPSVHVWCMPSVRVVYAFCARAFGVCLPCTCVWCMPSVHVRLVYAFCARVLGSMVSDQHTGYKQSMCVPWCRINTLSVNRACVCRGVRST